MQAYILDSEHTALTYRVHRLVRSAGAFTRIAGTVTTDDTGAPRSLDVTIAAASLRTGLAPRDDHLRSTDFLAAERFPTIIYGSHDIEQVAPDRYLVHGTLRMKGREHPVTLAAVLDAGLESDDGPRIQVSGELTREAFGIPANPVIVAIMHALVGGSVFVHANVFLVPVRAAAAVTPFSGTQSAEELHCPVS
jgi:polyisoprenoid-binding protein YceI